MRKPTLAEFQLNESALESAKKTRRALIIAALIWPILVLSIGIYLNPSGRWILLLLLALPPYGPVVFYYTMKSLVRRLIPRFGHAVAYEVALQDYEQWRVRTLSDFWTSLSGRAFEIELANLYRRLGFDALLTNRDTDKGVDIWLVKDGRRIPVQCKAHRRQVTPGAVRELYGTMQHFGVPTGVLASVSGFTRGVKNFASGKGIELVDLATIINWQRCLE